MEAKTEIFCKIRNYKKKEPIFTTTQNSFLRASHVPKCGRELGVGCRDKSLFPIFYYLQCPWVPLHLQGQKTIEHFPKIKKFNHKITNWSKKSLVLIFPSAIKFLSLSPSLPLSPLLSFSRSFSLPSFLPHPSSPSFPFPLHFTTHTNPFSKGLFSNSVE